MKLQTKLSIIILSGLVVIIGVAQIVQYQNSVELLETLAQNSSETLRAREQIAAHNVFHSVSRAVAGSLERGEMEKFTRLLEAQRDVEGLEEFSLYNRDGVVAYSSQSEFIGQSLPEEVRQQVLTDEGYFQRHVGQTLEAYQPQVVEPDCIRCHVSWNVGTVCGVISMRFSTRALGEAEQQAGLVLDDARQTFLRNSGIILVGIILFFTIMMFISLRVFVRRPLNRVTDALRDLARGDGEFTEQQPVVRSKDEIGALAGTLYDMQMTIQGVLTTLNTLILSIQNGHLDARGDADQFGGRWRTLTAGINNLIQTLAGHLDNIPIATKITGPDLTVRFVSRAGLSMLGNPKHSEVIGKKCFDLFHKDVCETPNCPCARSLESQHEEVSEARARLNDQDYHFTTIGVPMTNAAGEMAAAMEILVDQTAIRNVMNNTGETATTLLDAVQDLTVSSQQVSSTSNDQAAAVKEIVSTMEDSDQLAKSIARKVKDVTGMTQTTKQIVNNGLTVIQESLTKMDEIKEANARTIHEMRTLDTRIESIWEIVNMINSVADQTKIIAFNAELEASSAGEAGKNFETVANEVRRLANNTVASTTEIKAKIHEIQQSSGNLVTASEAGTVKIEEGWKLSKNLEQLFTQILESADVSDKAADQIALSIQQQVSAFEQILLTLKQIAEGVENFVVSTKSTSGAAETLRAIANKLHDMIEEYTGAKK